MVAALPSSIECRFVLTPYNETRERAVAEFQPDVGRPIRRKRQSRVHRIFSGTLNTTTAGLADFWTFWEDDLDQGMLSFTMPDPRGGATITVEFVEAQPPAFDRRASGRFEASCTLRVLS